MRRACTCMEEIKSVISSNSPLPEYLFCTYYNSLSLSLYIECVFIVQQVFCPSYSIFCCIVKVGEII